MARNSLLCADVPLRNYSLTHPPVVEETKFLGLIFDRKLTFIPHIKHLKDKCTKDASRDLYQEWVGVFRLIVIITIIIIIAIVVVVVVVVVVVKKPFFFRFPVEAAQECEWMR